MSRQLSYYTVSSEYILVTKSELIFSSNFEINLDVDLNLEGMITVVRRKY